jgi:hypothetical protein
MFVFQHAAPITCSTGAGLAFIDSLHAWSESIRRTAFSEGSSAGTGRKLIHPNSSYSGTDGHADASEGTGVVTT